MIIPPTSLLLVNFLMRLCASTDQSLINVIALYLESITKVLIEWEMCVINYIAFICALIPVCSGSQKWLINGGMIKSKWFTADNSLMSHSLYGTIFYIQYNNLLYFFSIEKSCNFTFSFIDLISLFCLFTGEGGRVVVCTYISGSKVVWDWVQWSMIIPAPLHYPLKPLPGDRDVLILNLMSETRECGHSTTAARTNVVVWSIHSKPAWW